MTKGECKQTFSYNRDDFLLFLSRFKGKRGPETVVQLGLMCEAKCPVSEIHLIPCYSMIFRTGCYQIMRRSKMGKWPISENQINKTVTHSDLYNFSTGLLV